MSVIIEQPTLEVKELRKYFDCSSSWLERNIYSKHRKHIKAVDGINFKIERGKTFGLVGESGCGKTTVARMVAGLIKPTDGKITISGNREGAVGDCQIQMIFQDPYSSMNPRWKIIDIVTEPIRESGCRISKQELKDKAVDLLMNVGLSSDDLYKFPHQFSGGQRQRISIARSLSVNPELLICDEPTSALDVSVQAQILNLIRKIQIEYNLACLFISHDLAVVHHVSDYVGVMYLGKMCEISDNDTLFNEAKHPYTQMLLEAIPDLETSELEISTNTSDIPNPIDPPSGCAYHPRCPNADSLCEKEQPILRKLGKSFVACHHPLR